VRPFKGIFCHDISEFESYDPSQAVGSLPAICLRDVCCIFERISWQKPPLRPRAPRRVILVDHPCKRFSRRAPILLRQKPTVGELREWARIPGKLTELAETMTVCLGSIAFRWATCVYFWARCTGRSLVSAFEDAGRSCRGVGWN
jgi:hypothetical protein